MHPERFSYAQKQSAAQYLTQTRLKPSPQAESLVAESSEQQRWLPVGLV
jgi:hypothetical protein